MGLFSSKPDHKWSNWEEYEQSMIHYKTQTRTTEMWQKRTCEVCGKTQREEVKGSYGQ